MASTDGLPERGNRARFDPGDCSPDETLAAVDRFNAAFAQHDVDGVMAAMTDDCVFENTSPAPNGTIYAGQNAVRAYWTEFFAASPDAIFNNEELIVAGDRCIVRWCYRWAGDGPEAGHVRGIDVFRVRHRKIAEKFSYVKG